MLNKIFITIANFIIGIFSSLPTHEIDIDLSSFDSFLGQLNYFVPFYLIAPIIKVWFGFIAVIIAIISVWGYIKRNF